MNLKINQNKNITIKSAQIGPKAEKNQIISQKSILKKVFISAKTIPNQKNNLILIFNWRGTQFYYICQDFILNDNIFYYIFVIFIALYIVIV